MTRWVYRRHTRWRSRKGKEKVKFVGHCHAVFRIRHPRRFTVRSTVRRAARAAFRTRWRAPDDLGAALTAFRRALRAHRRLARLAPQFFDAVTIERERREDEARRRWMAIWEPALDKVYGLKAKSSEPPVASPRLPSPRTQQAVERELACLTFWLSAGRMALEQHRCRRPHALIDLSRLARLLEIAMEFGRLATGIAPGLPDSDPDNHDAAWADLKRAYGHRCGSSSSEAGLPPAPVAQQGNTARNSGPIQSVPVALPGDIHPANGDSRSPPADLAACPPAPSPLEPRRSDAWSRWARHVRRLRG